MHTKSFCIESMRAFCINFATEEFSSILFLGSSHWYHIACSVLYAITGAINTASQPMLYMYEHLMHIRNRKPQALDLSTIFTVCKNCRKKCQELYFHFQKRVPKLRTIFDKNSPKNPFQFQAQFAEVSSFLNVSLELQL